MASASAQSIYAVIVLYNQTPAASLAFSAFSSVLAENRALAAHFHLLLYDNSLSAQQLELTCEYHHDARNEGLASAYNYALARAVEEECDWLLLLDQDTAVTRAYLEEAVALTISLQGQSRIGAIVPKLESAKGIKSPTLDFLEWLRRQIQFPRRRALFATHDMYGEQEEQFSAFNSASILRVQTLHKIGGFPAAFWLDFLDVAVFNALYASGSRIFLMHATLQHELSMDTAVFYERESGLERHRNLIGAMVRFVKTYGIPGDLWLARIWLARNAVNLFLSARDKRFAWASLKQAWLLSDRGR